jgi:hypothetical protein
VWSISFSQSVKQSDDGWALQERTVACGFFEPLPEVPAQTINLAISTCIYTTAFNFPKKTVSDMD